MPKLSNAKKHLRTPGAPGASAPSTTKREKLKVRKATYGHGFNGMEDVSDKKANQTAK